MRNPGITVGMHLFSRRRFSFRDCCKDVGTGPISGLDIAIYRRLQKFIFLTLASIFHQRYRFHDLGPRRSPRSNLRWHLSFEIMGTSRPAGYRVVRCYPNELEFRARWAYAK
jgi:hypothetical protein